MSTREAFATLIRVLGATYGAEIAPAAIEGYWLVMSELTEAQIKTALRRALAESKFMPRPSELLDFAGIPKADPKADAMICWQEVRRAIDVHDYTVRSIDFGPRVNAVVRNLGGWDILCQASLPELDNPGWLRKRFCEVYEAFVGAPVDSLRGDALEGKLPAKWINPVDVLVAIPGQPKPLELPAVDPTVARHVEELANAKS